MKVYVVELGCHEDIYIGGVYSTPEDAMTGRPGKFTLCSPGKLGNRTWRNDLHFDEICTITEYPLLDGK